MRLQWTLRSNRTQLSSPICHICVKAFRLWMVWCKRLQRSVQIVKIKDLCQDTHRTLHKGSRGSTLVPSPTTLLKIRPLLVLRCGSVSMVMLIRTFTNWEKSSSKLTISSPTEENLRRESTLNVIGTLHTITWNQDHVWTWSTTLTTVTSLPVAGFAQIPDLKMPMALQPLRNNFVKRSEILRLTETPATSEDL